MPAALLRATGIPIAGCRITRPHVLARGATQLNQSAVLLHTTAHAAAAAMLWLLWRGERSYIIMISTRVPVVLEKAIKHYRSDPAQIRSTLCSLRSATVWIKCCKEVLLGNQPVGQLLQTRFHTATLPSSRARGTLAIRLGVPLSRLIRGSFDLRAKNGALGTNAATVRQNCRDSLLWNGALAL